MSINSRFLNGMYLSLSFFAATSVAQQAIAHVSRDEIIAHNRALAAGEDDTNFKFSDDSADANSANTSQPSSNQLAAPSPEVERANGVPSAPAASTNNSDLTVRLLDKVDAQQTTINELRGQLETLRNESHQKLAQADKDIGDLKFRMDELEKRAKEQPRHVATSVAKAKTSVQAKTATAVKKEKGTKTPVAEKPHSIFATAQIQYEKKSYRQAAVSYYDAYKANAKTPIGAQSLLGLSKSMAAMNNKAAACQALSKLNAEFPRPATPLAVQAKSLAASEKC